MEVLLNTIYYKGNWAEPFSKHATQTDEFLTATGKAVDAEFSQLTRSYLALAKKAGILRQSQ